MTTGYLTIDDAPSADLPAKLALLGERDVPAFLFCEGRRLAEYPEHARRAVEAGYHLGNHTFSHGHASELSVDAFRDEVRRTEARIEDAYVAVGVERPATVFRFPYGDRGEWAGDGHADALQSVLAAEGFAPIDPGAALAGTLDADSPGSWAADGRDWGWTLDTEDWDCQTAAELRAFLETVAGRLHDERIAESEVVLFHDAGTDLALLEELLAYCDGPSVEFADPLDIVAE